MLIANGIREAKLSDTMVGTLSGMRIVKCSFSVRRAISTTSSPPMMLTNRPSDPKEATSQTVVTSPTKLAHSTHCTNTAQTPCMLVAFIP